MKALRNFLIFSLLVVCFSGCAELRNQNQSASGHGTILNIAYQNLSDTEKSMKMIAEGTHSTAYYEELVKSKTNGIQEITNGIRLTIDLSIEDLSGSSYVVSTQFDRNRYIKSKKQMDYLIASLQNLLIDFNKRASQDKEKAYSLSFLILGTADNNLRDGDRPIGYYNGELTDGKPLIISHSGEYRTVKVHDRITNAELALLRTYSGKKILDSVLNNIYESSSSINRSFVMKQKLYDEAGSEFRRVDISFIFEAKIR